MVYVKVVFIVIDGSSPRTGLLDSVGRHANRRQLAQSCCLFSIHSAQPQYTRSGGHSSKRPKRRSAGPNCVPVLSIADKRRGIDRNPCHGPSTAAASLSHPQETRTPAHGRTGKCLLRSKGDSGYPAGGRGCESTPQTRAPLPPKVATSLAQACP